MSHVATTDRLATRAEILSARRVLRALAEQHGLTSMRISADGTVVAHSDEAGYRAVVHYAQAASNVIGAWVNVITDDAPAAQGADAEVL